MKLGFDIDEVVCDLTKYLSNYLNENYGLDWRVENWITYDLIKCDYSGCGDEKFNEEIAGDLLSKAYDLNSLRKCPVVEGAARSLQLLKRGGHTLHFITTRELKKENITIDWLRANKIPFDSVHHVGHGGQKGFIGRALNLDFFLDDLEKNLNSMLIYKKRWKKGLALLDRPWNRNLYDGSKFIKLNNWNQVVRHLGIHNR